MSNVLQQIPSILASSLAPASLYALLGVGFVIIYRGTRVINFIQGQLALVGALIFTSALETLGHQYLIAALVAIGAALLIGAMIYFVIMSPLTGQGVLILIMLTLVLGTTIMNPVIAMIWSTNAHNLVLPLSRDAINLPGGAYITQADIATVIAAVVVIGALALVLRYARFGIAMRAAAENPTLAGYRGVNVLQTATMSWAVATVTATLAGIGDGVRAPIDFTMVGLGLYTFPALLIGGMDSIIGVLVGALVLAIIQNAAATYLGGAWTDVTAYVVMLLILMVRPYGFFGTKEFRRL